MDEGGLVGSLASVQQRAAFYISVFAICTVFIWPFDGLAGDDQRTLSDKFIFFDIAEQPLSSGLVEFGVQSNINIIVPADLVVVHKTSGLYGRYSIRRALDILLKDSEFIFRVIDHSNTIVIDRVPEAALASEERSSRIDDIRPPMEDVVIVSARKRQEDLHDVPMSISILRGREVEKSGVPDLVQLGSAMVNTTLKVTRGTNTTLAAYIRGIGTEDPLAGFESGVGVYIDDVYLNRPQGAVLDVYDIERVEVLRGPQGVYYGRNTIGGAIKYVTKRLGNEPYLKVKGYAGNFRQRDLILSASTPINPYVKLGASVGVLTRDGFGKNFFSGEENYDKDIVVGRFSLESSIGDNVLFRFTADETEDNSSPRSGRRFLLQEGEIPLSSVYDTRAGSSQSDHPIRGNYVSINGYAGQLEWFATPELTVESLTAYRRDSSESTIDFDSLPEAILGTAVLYQNRQFSQEFRFNLATDRAQYLLGAYYLNARSFNAFDVELDQISTGFGGGVFTLGDVDLSSLATFFSASFRIREDVETSFGWRYTTEEKRVEIERNSFLVDIEETFISPYFGGNAVPLLTEPVLDENGNEVAPRFRGIRKDAELTLSANISWQPEDDINLYFSYSSGFKPGGFDPRGDYSQQEVRKGFSPETVDVYEVGLKARDPNVGLTANISVFHNDYRNVQIAGSIPTDSNDDGVSDSFIGAVTNAARAKISGAEFLIEWQLTEAHRANLDIGVISSRYTTYIGRGEDLSQFFLFANTPNMSMSLNLLSEFSVWGGGVTQSIGVSFRSESWLAESPQDELRVGAYALFNASLVWENYDESWEVGFYGRNLTNEAYKTGAYYFPDLAVGSAYYGDPRTFTLSLTRAF